LSRICSYAGSIEIAVFGRPTGQTPILSVLTLGSSYPASPSKLGKSFRESVNIDRRRASAYIEVLRVEEDIIMSEKDIIEIAGKRLIRLSTFAEDMGLHIRMRIPGEVARESGMMSPSIPI
jgi:hypothetical protein